MKHARQNTSPFPWLVLAASLMVPAGLACAQTAGSDAKQDSGAPAPMAPASSASEPTSGTDPLSPKDDSKARQQQAPSDRTPLVSSPSPAPATSWTQMPGAANDVGAGGEVWVVGANRTRGGYGIWRWDGRQWQSVAGAGVRLDVGARGDAWLVDEAGTVFLWKAGRWVPVPGGTASDIGVGADGSVWITGTRSVSGGKNIARWTGSQWQAMPGGAVRIDVDPQGNAWVVNDNGGVFRWNGNGWLAVEGVRGLDIGIGANGRVFLLDRQGGVNTWDGRSWNRRDGGLTNISVDLQGVPYGVNADHLIWKGTP